MIKAGKKSHQFSFSKIILPSDHQVIIFGGNLGDIEKITPKKERLLPSCLPWCREHVCQRSLWSLSLLEHIVILKNTV